MSKVLETVKLKDMRISVMVTKLWLAAIFSLWFVNSITRNDVMFNIRIIVILTVMYVSALYNAVLMDVNYDSAKTRLVVWIANILISTIITACIVLYLISTNAEIRSSTHDLIRFVLAIFGVTTFGVFAGSAGFILAASYLCGEKQEGEDERNS